MIGAGPHLSHSRINTEATCPRKAYLHYDLRLEPNVRSAALRIGATLADALEQGVVPAIEAMWTQWEASVRRAEGNPWIKATPRAALEKDEAMVRGAYRGYIDVYGQPTSDAREVEYRAPIDGTPYHLLGRADAVREQVDGLVVIEDKWRAKRQTMTALDQQLRYSAWGLTATQEKRPVEFRYRQHTKPAIKQKRGEDWADFLLRLEENQSDPKKFHEDVIYVHELPRDADSDSVFIPSDSVDQVPAELRAWATTVAMRHAVGNHPPVTSRCDDFGGCEYLPICRGEPGAMHGFHVREAFNPQAQEATTT